MLKKDLSFSDSSKNNPNIDINPSSAFERLDRTFVDSYRNKKVPWGFDGLGYIVYKRTYARTLEQGGLEEWVDTVERCINGAQEIGAGYTKEEAEKLFDLMFNLKCSFAGRMLWQLGTGTVRRIGLPSLCNCWFTLLRKPEDFCFMFEHLMLGGGVGFSVRKEDVHEFPRIKPDVKIVHQKTTDADFIVPDSREGWVELLRKVLDSFFVTGKSFTFSTILVRPEGEPIKTFGGKSSGPRYLIEGIEKICGVLKNREGKKLRSIDALDIANIIGSIVVSGNVRRSAELAIGDPDDYLYLKSKRWDLGNVPNWRAMSNNSIYVDTFEQISQEVWDGYYGTGEPFGFINIRNARKFGRIGELRKDNVEGFNPCAEAQLEDKEPCDLSEIFLNNIESYEEFLIAAKLLYKTQKAVLTLPSISEETTKVTKRNMRIGLGVTGIVQSMGKLEWLEKGYKELQQFDKEWSRIRGWNESIRLTVVKPSGTLSLLAGSTPGVHPAFSRYYIRRIRMSSSDNLVPLLRSSGYHIEYVRNFDGSENHDTVVVSFPCFVGDNVITAKDMSAVDQLELVKKLQAIWADQSVSVTVYYKKDEITAIQEWLKQNFEKSMKTVSFLLHSEHGFDQAPYEEITKDIYEKMVSKLKPIQNISDERSWNSLEDLECGTGACPIK